MFRERFVPSAVVRAYQRVRMGQRAVNDPAVGVAGAPQLVALTASPMTVTNLTQGPELYYVSQLAGATGTVTKGGIALLSATTPAATIIPFTILLAPGQSFVYTYNAGANTITRDAI